MQHHIHEVTLNAIDGRRPMVDYTDGDLAIIDNVRQLSELDPLKVKMNFIIMCTDGRIQLDVNGRERQLTRNDVLFSGPGVVLDKYMFSPDFECKILCLSPNIIQGLLREEAEVWNRAVYVRRMNIVHLPDEEVALFGLYYALIRQKINGSARPFAKEAMQTLVKSLLLDFCSVLSNYFEQSPIEKATQGRLLLERFLQLLSAQQVKRRPVGHYASQLAVTPKYLTMVCERYSGKPASEWVNQYVVEDVRHALKNTGMPMKEIANQLGFANISHFGSYVRRFFGMSPTAYRAHLRREQAPQSAFENL